MPGHLYRDGKIWYGWFYTDGKQIRRSTRCTDRRAAELVLRDWERRAADPTSVPTNPTVEQALARLCSDREAKGRSSETVSMYEKKGGHLVRIWGAERAISTIDAVTVDGYVEQRLREGASRSTIGKELTTIRSMLKVARRRGEYSRDVASVMPDGFSIEYTPRRTFLTRQQLAILLDALKPGRAARVAWIVATAARWGESDRARREDVSATTVAMRGTKTKGSAALVPVLEFVRELLGRAVRDADGPKAGPMFRPWANNVRRDLHAACKRAEKQTGVPMPLVSPNDLRRTLATWLRQAGAPPHLIGSMLRHRDSRMVEVVYGRMPVEDLGAALERLTNPDGGLMGSGGHEQNERRGRKRRAKKTA